MMETAAVYATHVVLCVMAWRRVGPSPGIAILAAALPVSWLVCDAFRDVDQDVVMAVLDLSVIIALMEWRGGPRDRIAALLALGMIFLRGVHIADGERFLSYWTFAALINAIVGVQFLVAGGMADDVGRWIDDRAGRLSRRLQTALRMVAC